MSIYRVTIPGNNRKFLVRSNKERDEIKNSTDPQLQNPVFTALTVGEGYSCDICQSSVVYPHECYALVPWDFDEDIATTQDMSRTQCSSVYRGNQDNKYYVDVPNADWGGPYDTYKEAKEAYNLDF